MMPISTLGGIAREAGVAVERDAVAHLGQDREVADLDAEAGVGGAAQQAVELLDLAALALPSHPAAFGVVPLPQPVKQEEAIRPPVAVLAVERVDARPRRLEDLGVARQGFGGGVAEVAEHREVDVRIDVAERLHLEVCEKLLDLVHAIESGRHNHHRARGRRHRFELEARQPARRNQDADDALQDLDGELARRDHGQQRDEDQRRLPASRASARTTSRRQRAAPSNTAIVPR